MTLPEHIVKKILGDKKSKNKKYFVKHEQGYDNHNVIWKKGDTIAFNQDDNKTYRIGKVKNKGYWGYDVETSEKNEKEKQIDG
jgi:hypothetical protein